MTKKTEKPEIVFTAPSGSVIKLQYEVNEYRAYRQLSDGRWSPMMLGGTSPDNLKAYIMRKEVSE